MNWEMHERKQPYSVLKYYPSHLPDRLDEHYKTVSWDCQHLGQNYNLGLLKCEPSFLTSTMMFISARVIGRVKVLQLILDITGRTGWSQ
jgi:hypothetical protein